MPIVERWNVVDLMGFMQQAGVIPTQAEIGQ